MIVTLVVAFVSILIILVLVIELMAKKKMDSCVLVEQKDGYPLVIPRATNSVVVETFNGIVKPAIGLDKENLGMKLLQAAKKNKNKTGMYLSWFVGRLAVTAFEEDVIKEVLVKKGDIFKKFTNFVESFDKMFGKNVASVEGETWKNQRNVINPSFHYLHLKKLVPTFVITVNKCLSKWEKYGKTCEPFEISNYLSKLTLDSLGNAAFSHDFATLDDKLDQEYHDYRTIVDEFANPLRSIKYYEKLNIKRNKDYFAASERFFDFLKGITEKRKDLHKKNEENGEVEKYDDLLELMVKGNEENILSDEELIHNMLIFFLAGHETTSNTLGFIIALLALNQDVQDRLYKEIVEHTQDGVHPTYDELKEMDYLNQVIKETFRLWPTAFVISRVCSKDTTLNGYFIPKGTILLLNSFSVNRDPEIWGEDCDSFDPDRMEKDNIKGKNPFLGFGIGSRSCLGNNFSLLEMRLFICMTLLKYKIKPHTKEIKIPRNFALALDPSFKISIESR
eukprot:TRINITY_DN5225_c0_g1_i1.p1 TRINITY_DN5225_c0_g1~~TRINITY_DN5225_c0_g1_i1.p1  ORF type:complete len:506 (+),score=157.75 TRINITY_DN5225_c0_g1_i1:92-1609(+)